MTSEPGTTAPSGPAGLAEPVPDKATRADTTVAKPTTPAGGRPPALDAGILAVLALSWLAAMLYSARVAISTASAGLIAITSAAYALPGVISASLVAGMAVSLVSSSLLVRAGIERGSIRSVAAIGAGLLVGVLAATALATGGSEGSAVMVLAGTVAGAATIGAAAGALRVAPVAAVVAAALVVFTVGFALNLFQDPILSLYGFGSTQSSQLSALSWFALTASISSGVAAGLTAFAYLRRAGRRAAAGQHSTGPLRWTAYLSAGAGSGLLLLAAEVIARTAGAQVLALAGALSEADEIAQRLLADSRINHALVVLFAGAIVALIAFGRTLRPAEESDTEAGATKADEADRTEAGSATESSDD